MKMLKIISSKKSKIFREIRESNQISEELHMNCRDGAQEIADILYKDLFKDNYRKIFAENKNGDTSLFRFYTKIQLRICTIY